MSEGNPNGQWHKPELNDLIRELEAQIESVNAGLSKIRGTVARISFTALGSTNPPPATPWDGLLSGAAANAVTWQAAAAEPTEPISIRETLDAPAPTLQTPVSLSAAFAPEPVMPVVEHAEPEAEPGFWTSVAEGASWPRAASDSPPDVAPRAPAWPGLAPREEPGLVPAANAWDVASAEETVPAPAIDTWDVAKPVEDAADASDEVPAPAFAREPAVDEIAAWEFDEPVETSGPVAPSVEPAAMPSTLSSGWPDESAWSQNFAGWPVKGQDASPPPEQHNPEDGDTRAAVSDMVARMRAELASARQREIAPADGSTEESTGIEDTAAAAFDTPMAPEVDDEAKRAEVSRAVAAMREQIQSGEYESVLRGNGFDDGSGHDMAEETPAVAMSGLGALSEEEMRAEVRRAVEATREELSSGVEEAMHEPARPAFKLAAPGSIPDWSHMKMEPSGPPVVVLKDADGRVELASVFETLNELGCGDGAALLNYTPHSVTVGLPISANFPSKERVSEAVEKVFGLTSRVESDGVRITVSIGEDPRMRSVDAA